VSVSGLTTAEVAQKLEQLLSPLYTSPPQVSVKIETYKSPRAFVVGAVPPATFVLRDDTTLLEILSQLKGLNTNSYVMVYRRAHASAENQDGEQKYDTKPIQIDLERLLQQGDMSLNLVLQPQDVIYVPDAATIGENQRVFVVGALPPATFTIKDGTTLLEVLSQIKEFKSRTYVVVYRRGHADGKSQDGEQGYDKKSIRVDLDRLLRQGDMSLNLVLEPRDVIYIPGGNALRSITVMGEVKRPGPIDLPEDSDMTVLQAIAAAGGLGEWAMPSRIRVLRIRDGQEQTIKVDVSAIMSGKLSQDIQLMPGDVIVVPERTLF
jgi:polysaccharide export outer membrane protein